MRISLKILICILIQALIITPLAWTAGESVSENTQTNHLSPNLQISNQDFVQFFKVGTRLLDNFQKLPSQNVSNNIPEKQTERLKTPQKRKNRASRKLKIITTMSIITALLLSTGFGYAIFLADTIPSLSLISSLSWGVVGFGLMIFPANFVISTAWAIVSVIKVIRSEELINNKSFANVPLAYTLKKENAPKISIIVPVYTEPFNVIEKTLNHARQAAAEYTKKTGVSVNIIVCEDGLNVFSDNNIQQYVDNALTKLQEDRTIEENEVVARINYYRKYNIGFVARPKPIAGVEYTQRPGKFKKASNINYMFRLGEEITAYLRQKEVSEQEAMHNVLLQEKYKFTVSEGSLEVGELFLLLDKDSITHKDVLVKTAAEFIEDPSLAYTQHVTFPISSDENYFTRIVGYFTENVFNIAIKAKVLLGAQIPFVGHNGIIRTDIFREIGLFYENRVSEDLYFSLSVHKQGYHGKYIAYKELDFGEAITRAHHEESGKFYRYAFGVVEMVFNPVWKWSKNGLINNEFRDFLAAKNISGWHKLDMLIYKTSYLNLALAFPTILLAIITAESSGFLLMTFIKSFLVFNLFSVLINTMARFKSKTFFKEGNTISFLKNLFYNQTMSLFLGLSIMAMPIYIVKGFFDFFFTRKNNFPATSIDTMVNPTLREIIIDMNVTNKMSAVIIGSGALAASISTFVLESDIVPIAAFCILGIQLTMPYLFNPFLMKKMGSFFYEGISRLRRFSLHNIVSQKKVVSSEKVLVLPNSRDMLLNRRNFLRIVMVIGAVAGLGRLLYPLRSEASDNEESLFAKELNWLNGNRSKKTGLPFSFYIPEMNKEQILKLAKNSAQRIIWDKGVVIYDSSLAQMFWALQGDMSIADRITNNWWKDRLGVWQGMRAFYDGTPAHPFIYRNKRGKDISSWIKGKRGFMMRIVHGDGAWPAQDPLTKQKQEWKDWQPIAGDNAWAGVIGPMQVYYKKYGKTYRKDAKELLLAEEIAKAAMLLQADNGAIRMAPLGTWFEKEQNNKYLYDTVSIENNLSWYAAFRMLYTITGKNKYRKMMDDIESFLKQMFVPEFKYFYQGTHWNGQSWQKNGQFATDCQSWAILALGPAKIDSWFGAGTTYEMLNYMKEKAGAYDAQGQLAGFDFTDYRSYRYKPLISYEWSAEALLAFKNAGEYYKKNNVEIKAQVLLRDVTVLLKNLKKGKVDFNNQRAYPYASGIGDWKERKTGFGWTAPPEQVLSVASTVWMSFAQSNFNPLVLGGEMLFSSLITPKDIKAAEAFSVEKYSIATAMLSATRRENFPIQNDIFISKPEAFSRKSAQQFLNNINAIKSKHPPLSNAVIVLERSL